MTALGPGFPLSFGVENATCFGFLMELPRTEEGGLVSFGVTVALESGGTLEPTLELGGTLEPTLGLGGTLELTLELGGTLEPTLRLGGTFALILGLRGTLEPT